jgi:hypothetical protein
VIYLFIYLFIYISHSLTDDAKKFVNSQEKKRALMCLKQRKYIQDVMEKRLEAQQQLQMILLKIQQAESDGDILKAYQYGTTTLADMMTKYGLTVDQVDKTMLHLEQVLADQHEVDMAITSGMSSLVETDDDKMIEQELEALMITDLTSQLERIQIPTSPLPKRSSSLPQSATTPPSPMEKLTEPMLSS